MDVNSPKLVRYGKPSGPLLKHKQAFFEQNDSLLAERLRIGEVYTRQPRRTQCKCCGGPLGAVSFRKQEIDYMICQHCGHLNGAHEDTRAFCREVYTNDEGASYGSVYSAESKDLYDSRTQDIYLPKAAFLIEALTAAGEKPTDLSYVDLGAGAGYFVAALLQCDVDRVQGLEVSKFQVDLANRMIGDDRVKEHALEDITGIAAEMDADVVSLIGVLEHLSEPCVLLKAFNNNPVLKYIFLSVPLFSPSNFFEMVFPTVFHRHLSGGHTHLYTASSLDWTCREFGFECIAEWWFGTDVVDWYRSVMVRLGQQPETRKMAETWGKLWAPVIDSLQMELDRRHLASQVHMLWRILR